MGKVFGVFQYVVSDAGPQWSELVSLHLCEDDANRIAQALEADAIAADERCQDSWFTAEIEVKGAGE